MSNLEEALQVLHRLPHAPMSEQDDEDDEACMAMPFALQVDCLGLRFRIATERETPLRSVMRSVRVRAIL